MSADLRERYHLNILCWKNEPYFDGSFKTTKTLKMDFKELPEWFTMNLVDKDNKVQQTEQMMKYANLNANYEELIAIVLQEKKTTKEMFDIAKNSNSCSEEECDCCDSESEEVKSQ